MDIAIIGVSIKCSKVNNIQEFLEILKSEKVCIGQPSIERIENSRIEKKKLYYPYGYMDRNDLFDSSFFNLSKAEADAMDPSHRLLLESVCEALENSGYDHEYLSGKKAGLFTSTQSGEYNLIYQSPNSELDFVGGLSSMAAGRIAYFLNISGSVMNIDTACSSSLVAVHEAVQKLKNNDLDIAIVGGTRILYQFNELQELENNAIMSSDGQCKAFDDDASGTSGGEGVAVIILKRLEDAVKDKDNILTVIKGSAINHDGNTSNGVTAPSPMAQKEVILNACKNADIAVSSIGYIETHGTGTKLGDPIEYKAIKDAFSDNETYSVRLGTLKPNIGHLDNLSGLAGLIKACLVLKEKEFFPLMNFNKLNKFIEEDSNIIVKKSGDHWHSEEIRRAGVSSFGLSGTNSHVILEEYVGNPTSANICEDGAVFWLKVSAKKEKLLSNYIDNIYDFILQADNSQLKDITFTLNNGRTDYKYGVAVYGKTVLELGESLLRQKGTIENLKPKKNKKIALLFLSDEIAELEYFNNCENFKKLYSIQRDNIDELDCSSSISQTLAIHSALYSYLMQKGFAISHVICNGDLAKVSKQIIAGKTESFKKDISFDLNPTIDLEKLKILINKLKEENTALVVCGSNNLLLKQIDKLAAQEDLAVIDLVKNVEQDWNILWSSFYTNDVRFNWKSFYLDFQNNRKQVPTYPFEKQSCWNSIKNPLLFGTNKNEFIEEKGSALLDLTEEGTVVKILQEVLQNDTFLVTDDFFELGGNSIVGIQFINRINDLYQINIEFEELFNCYEINDIICLVKSKCKNKEEFTGVLEHIEVDFNELNSFELSSSQRRMWVESQNKTLSLAYNIIIDLNIEGNLDKEIFKKVLKVLIKNNHSLRTSFFVDKNGNICQKIIPVEEVNLEQVFKYEYIDDLESREKRVKEICNSLFNLENGPLFRTNVIQFEENKNQLIFSFHHIIFDGWSSGIFMSEFVRIYKMILNNSYEDFDKKESYLDYIFWIKEHLSKEKEDSYKLYWQSKLFNVNTKIDLGDVNVTTFNGHKLKHFIDPQITLKLNSIARENRATLFAVLIASVRVYLYRLASENFVIGTPVSGRIKKEFESMIGLFVNTVPIYNEISEEKSFERCIAEEMESVTKALEYQSYPFDKILEDLNIEKGTSLFDVMVILQNQNNRSGLVNDNDVPFVIEVNNSQEEVFTRFNLTFTFFEMEEGIELELHYNKDVFGLAFAENLLENFSFFIKQLLDFPAKNISKQLIMSIEQQDELVLGFNDTAVECSKELTLVDLFEEQVKQNPDKIAVLFGDLSITYAGLNDKANQLAYYLRENYSIQPDDFVGIKLERSEKTIIAILGVLKSGGAYVPIDVDYPSERIKYIEKDSNSKVVIDKKEFDKFNASFHKYSKENINKVNKVTDLAYIIYTSGTTGDPKGVMIEHINAVELINWAKLEFDISKIDVVYAVTSQCFDLSIFEMFFPLSVGIKVRILSNALFIKDYISKDSKILLNTVPSVMRKLLDDNMNFQNVTYINLAGEALPVDIVKKLQFLPIEVRNLYGPSEDTTYSTNYVITDKEYKTIPIGRPLTNKKVYILNDDFQPVPIGVSGKIYVSGAGIARGYLNKPLLTNEKFITNPFIQGIKMYDTGDLGKWSSDGNIEFLGRKDHQVKIRGFRIELGEIENAIIKNSDNLKQVVVEAREHQGEKVLVAYLVPDGEIDKSKVREIVQDKLPDYMVPGFYIIMESLPLTPNGKTDRKALPDVRKNDIIRKKYTGPRNITEEKLIKIWEEVLGVEDIGIEDNFFSLGGQSIIAVKVVSIINNEFKTDYPLNILFHVETIKELSYYISNGYDFKNDYHEYGVSSSPKTIFAFPPILGYGTAYKNLFNDVKDVKVIAFNFLDNVQDLVAYYANQINTLQQHGDIILFGWSAGGNLSYEVANYLKEKLDRKVSSIIMLDSYAMHEENFDLNDVSDVDEYIKYDLGLQKLFENDNILQNAKDKLFTYLKYLHKVEYKQKNYSQLYLIKSEEPMGNYNWDMTFETIHSIQGKGDHYSMLQDDHFQKNKDLINEVILKTLN